MGNKTYSELIEEAKLKVDLIKTSPSASDNAHLLADSLSDIIKAFEDYISTPISYGRL